jgi:replication initiation and membrane attachment protein DnaB
MKEDMEIKPADIFTIERRGNLSTETASVLLTMYQPLIGGDAVLLYMTLSSFSAYGRNRDSHGHLFTVMNNIDPDTFQRARVKLEEYMLMRSYAREDGTKQQYIYTLLSPMRADDFFSTAVYAARLHKVLGDRAFNSLKTNMSSARIAKEGFKDITVPVVMSQSADYDNEVVYTDVKPKYMFSNDDENISFDYDHFLAITSTLVFPAELRTKENMNLIGRIATVYGLSADRMLILVNDCVSLSTMQFDAQRLKWKASRQKPDITKADDPYMLPPVSFLMSKQHGAEVTATDKKTLEHLSIDMKFPNEVINTMLEYILGKSDNRLTPRFVDMVSSQWARDGIHTRREAVEETKREMSWEKNRYRNNMTVPTPDSYREAEKADPSKIEKLSPEELEEFKKFLGK